MPDYQASEAKAVAAIKKAIPASLKKDMVPSSKGFPCELYENDAVFPDHYLGCAIDSVGTKVILAEAMGRYGTIGRDCVAMSANDLATFGQMSPFLFIDCLSVQDKAQEHAGAIVKGISKALGECDAGDLLRSSVHINFGKGETASVSELLSGTRPGSGFDLVGGMIGFVPKKAALFTAKPGMAIVAIPSSGLHSNGFTTARHALLKGEFETRKEYRSSYRGRFSLDSPFEGSTIGETLLTPTTLYVRDMARISAKHAVLGVNNTGYGLKNLSRVPGDARLVITDPLPPPPIFALIQKEAKLSDEQMYTTFNMGMGFFVLCAKDEADDVAKLGKGKVVGHVEKGKKEVVMGDLRLSGY